jgi:hypothetical protein
VHVAPACTGPREGSDHFMSYVHNIFLYFCKRLFSGLEPMTSWSQGSNFTASDTEMKKRYIKHMKPNQNMLILSITKN